MKVHIGTLTLLICMNGLVACTSAQEKAAEADAEYTREKTKTLQEYKECAKDAGDDEEDLKECEALLKALEAVEGSAGTTEK